jgi:hypothetical protein
MLGLSGVIACITPKPIRVDAPSFTYSHVRRFQGLCRIRDLGPPCERVKILNGIRSPIQLRTLRLGS